MKKLILPLLLLASISTFVIFQIFTGYVAVSAHQSSDVQLQSEMYKVSNGVSYASVAHTLQFGAAVYFLIALAFLLWVCKYRWNA